MAFLKKTLPKKLVQIILILTSIQGLTSYISAKVPTDKNIDTKILDPISKPNRYQLFFNNEFDNMIAPFTYQSSAILLGGGLATYLVFKDKFEEKRQNRTYRKWKRRKLWSTVGDTLGWGVLPIAYLSLKAIQNYLDSNENKASIERRSLRWQNAEYVTKTVAFTALTTFALKLTTNQGRPKDRLKKDSFPSGHASSSFAFSTAVWLAHGPYWGTSATLVAGWISFSRIDDGSHYYHDSIFGAALGASYAWGIFTNHYRRNLPFKFAVGPSQDLKGLTASYSLKF
jgi:membrane-associated phospholipid phosphatase